MTCMERRQQLEQSFGQIQLEATLGEHLNGCAECREYWEQLARLAEKLPDDASFAVDANTIDALVQRVDRTIDSSNGVTSVAKRDSHESSPWTLMKMLPAAAALLVVVGVGIGGYLVGRTGFDPKTSTADQSTSLLVESTVESDYDEPDDPTLEILLSDFAADRLYDASEKLLDDITDEEMDYLAQNFDVGDLL